MQKWVFQVRQFSKGHSNPIWKIWFRMEELQLNKAILKLQKHH
jgi:hypothetical protein